MKSLDNDTVGDALRVAATRRDLHTESMANMEANHASYKARLEEEANHFMFNQLCSTARLVLRDPQMARHVHQNRSLWQWRFESLRPWQQMYVHQIEGGIL